MGFNSGFKELKEAIVT